MPILKKENAKRRHPLLHAYNSMIQRCNNTNNTQYKDYGGRGITVCERWLENQPNAQGFWNFVEDMGEKPAGSTMDRLDNSKGYAPENCRWATRSEQQRNRRNNVFITYNNKTQCVKDWATELNMSDSTILRRFRAGLPVNIVLSQERFTGKRF